VIRRRGSGRRVRTSELLRSSWRGPCGYATPLCPGPRRFDVVGTQSTKQLLQGQRGRLCGPVEVIHVHCAPVLMEHPVRNSAGLVSSSFLKFITSAERPHFPNKRRCGLREPRRVLSCATLHAEIFDGYFLSELGPKQRYLCLKRCASRINRFDQLKP
jgi:hypothetical protein